MQAARGDEFRRAGVAAVVGVDPELVVGANTEVLVGRGREREADAAREAEQPSHRACRPMPAGTSKRAESLQCVLNFHAQNPRRSF